MKQFGVYAGSMLLTHPHITLLNSSSAVGAACRSIRPVTRTAMDVSAFVEINSTNGGVVYVNSAGSAAFVFYMEGSQPSMRVLKSTDCIVQIRQWIQT